MLKKIFNYLFVSPQLGGGRIDFMDIDCPDGFVQNPKNGNCEEITINPTTGRALKPHSNVNPNGMKIDTIKGMVFNPQTNRYEKVSMNDATKRLVKKRKTKN